MTHDHERMRASGAISPAKPRESKGRAEKRWVAYEGDDNTDAMNEIVIVKEVEVLVTDKLVRLAKRYELPYAVTMKTQWAVGESSPLSLTRSDAIERFRNNLVAEKKSRETRAKVCGALLEQIERLR